MRLSRFYPRSLAGQLALLVAVALFVAQAINFGIIFRARQGEFYSQVIAPAVARLSDAAERVAGVSNGTSAPELTRRERAKARQNGPRVELLPGNPLPGAQTRASNLEADIRKGLVENGVRHGQVIVVIRKIEENDPLPGINPQRAEWLRRVGGELVIAVELPGRGWLVQRSGWQHNRSSLIWPLLGQTLMFYIIVLVPLLLAGRRIARPLIGLAHSARTFRPGDESPPLEEQGPSDIRAVIVAYNALRLRVTAMLEEKDRMLGAIGHDLRTPLAALRVRIESVEDDDDRTRMAATIDEMNRTLDDILSLARLGRPSEPATDVDLSALIDAVVEDFRDLDHDVSFEEAPRLKMRLRPSLMRRALRNLIENAVKYADGAEVRLVPGEHHVAIEVADRGPGIPSDKLTAVFDPFTRLESSRNRETGGIGLGLALARAIVSEAGGEIILANRQGGGLTATITLPRS